MNEKIKELAIQVQRTEMPGVLFVHPEFVEKFAELLVNETLEKLHKTLDDSHDVRVFEGLRLAQAVIKKHFGVEE